MNGGCFFHEIVGKKLALNLSQSFVIKIMADFMALYYVYMSL